MQLLSTLPFESVSQDWGDAQRDQSVEHHTLHVGGEFYRYGFGSHANSRIVLDLCADGKCVGGSLSGTLHAVVGLDEESAGGDGAEFAVHVGDREIWHSKRLYSGDAMKLQIPLEKASLLELRVIKGDNMDCDHGDWANAWISNIGDR